MEKIAWVEILISLANIHIILMNIFHGRIKARLLIVLGFAVLFPCFILSFFYFEYPAGKTAILLCNMLNFLVPLFTVTQLSRIKIMFASLLYLGVSSTIIVSWVWIARILELDISIIIAVDVLIQLVFLFLCIVLTRKPSIINTVRHIEMIPIGQKTMLIISVWSSDALAYLLSSVLLEMPRTNRLVVVECLVALLILLIGIMWPFLIATNVANITYKNTLLNLEGRMQEQVRYYELVNKANTDIRAFKHNFSNLKLGLVSFLDNNDAYGALKYLQGFEKPFHADYIIYETGNYVADAIFSEKQRLAMSINAEITFDGLIPNQLIDATDVCIIFGNALDNALEACLDIPAEIQKTIQVTSYMNNGFLFLTVQNPTFQNIIINDNNILTSKKDKMQHGFGLKSIKKSVSQYDGSLTITCENNSFVLKIFMDFNNSGISANNDGK